jgi:hypothetical protein
LIILRSLPVAIEDLSDPSRLPTVDELRPVSCPGCGRAAHASGPRLGIVGHGTYQRQVLGLVPGRAIVIRIRRYLCQACRKTISVLPDVLLPWRWYTAGAILAVLVGALIARNATADLRESRGPGGRAPHWTTPARWSSALLERLWAWMAAELGGSVGIEPTDRLRRLLGLLGVHARSPDEELIAATRLAARGTVHMRRSTARLGHAF